MPSAWSGRSRLIADISKEQSEETSRWGARKREAERQRERESSEGNLFSMIGTLIALPFLGPAAPLAGSIFGNLIKSGIVDESKNVMDATDTGRWNVAEDREALEQLNRDFSAYDTAEFWGGMQDIGASALFTSKFGGGFGSEGFNPFQWGGEGGQTTGQMVKGWFSKGGSNPYSFKTDPQSASDWIEEQYYK